MSKVDLAVSAFKEGFLCSQALLSTYGVAFGLDRERAIKISAAFGGGICRMGETCGAVTAALMVVGLKHGSADATDREARERTYGLAREFVRRFAARHHSVRCKDLLDCDISEPEGYAAAREKKLFDTLCPRYVRAAAEILEAILD
jgi:C_GCAxxG_C_C family probable redox protein